MGLVLIQFRDVLKSCVYLGNSGGVARTRSVLSLKFKSSEPFLLPNLYLCRLPVVRWKIIRLILWIISKVILRLIGHWNQGSKPIMLVWSNLIKVSQIFCKGDFGLLWQFIVQILLMLIIISDARRRILVLVWNKNKLASFHGRN